MPLVYTEPKELAQKKVADIESAYILKEQEGDPNDEMPLAGFVTKGKHPQVNPQTPKTSRQEKEESLGYPFCSHLLRPLFIDKHDEKRQEIHENEEGYKNSRRWIHTMNY